MVPHYNYRPPAGAVIDASDPRLRWDGSSWILGRRVFAVPAGHRLVGTSNGSHRGWYYDWSKHAWMEPSAPKPPPPAPRPAAGGARPQPLPQPRPQPRPAPVPVPVPVPQPKPQAPARPVKEEFVVMEKKPHTVLEDLMKHPIAPVLGGLMVLAGYVTDEPVPPQIPEGLPEPVAKQWQMVYAQNMQRFDRRMSLYRDLGLVLLGYSGTRSIVDVIGGLESRRALPEKRAA